MGTYTKPGDLAALKEPLIESVINAYMAKEVTSDDMQWSHGGCKDKEFRYKYSKVGLDTKAYVSYPDGQWKIDQWLDPDDEASPGDDVNGRFTLFDAVAAWEEIRTWVSSWIDPWIACQDPDNIAAGEIEQLAEVVAQLYVFDEVRFEVPTRSGDSTGADSDSTSQSDERAVTPVGDIRAAILGMENQLSSLNGLAIDALEDAYVDDVGFTLSGQRVLAAIATLAVSGEAEAWYQAYAAVGSFFENATKDFNTYADAPEAEDGADTELSIVSGVTGLLSLATAGFAPASVALGAVSGLTGLAGNFYGGKEGTVPVQLRLEGADYQAKLQSFQDQVLAVELELFEVELGLGEMCQAGLDTYYRTPDGFSITSKGRRSRGTFPGVPYAPPPTTPAPSDPQPGDDLGRFMGADQNSHERELYNSDVVNVVHGKLRTVAAQIERVSDHQREVAGKVGAVTVANQWSRAMLQGQYIGSGASGHRQYYQKIVEELADLLLKESETARRVAEHCYDIATDFSKTDSEIEAGLERLEANLP